MESVKVALRMRPMVESERERGCQEAISRVPGEPQVILNNDPFTYDFVFDQNESQEKLFDESVVPMLKKLHSGFNVTILAYGQTGSGKTYTMGTTFNGVLDKNAGVIPRAMNEIFRKVDELSDQYKFEIKCSFLELYQEQLYDLLSGKPREQSIVEIREDKNGIHIPDLTHETVSSALETTECLMRGSIGRAVAATAMNEVSSRSHAIFTVTLQYEKLDDSHTVTTAKFHLVDLAGSERSKKTKATGERFKEGVKINHGLLALGNVISALGSEKNAGFVRYRDSKLTRLLQDSLGGNSCTLMIACVSPADYNIPETLSTLRYADRAKKIKNKPIINQDPHAAEISRLKGVIQKLRLDLLAATSGSSSSLESIPALAIMSPRKTCNDKMYRDLQEKYRNLQLQLQKTLHDVVENEMRAHIAEAAHEKLKIKTEELKISAKELEFDINANESKIDATKIQKMVNMIISLDEELEKTVSEMNDHKQNQIEASINDNENELSEEGGAEIEKEADVYNNKQFKYKEELFRINRELNLKEQLQQRLAGNLTKFCTLDTSAMDKFEECQLKIRELEDEKAELLEKLNHVKDSASAKLAEERRKRLQILEQDLNVMKSKIKQQSSLLKVREKEQLKVQNLNREIQLMKESKVKLIRSMRQEAENFRQWKLTREKELIQMKNKGRKMECEMAKKDALHTKQRNVLKRKCEEAMAINKRLKDALERQSVAQAQRQKLQTAKDNNTKRIENVVAIVERELEVITSIIDAEQSLDHLMEDRGVINRRINELRSNESSNPDELVQLEDEYEMRNAQITELQQKVCVADLETRIRALCDTAQNMVEARAVFKHLTNSICEMRRDHANRLQEQKAALDECRTQRQVIEQEMESTAKRLKMSEKDHQEAMVEIERTYEEKVACLLNELHSKGSGEQETVDGVYPVAQIQNELHEKLESMRQENARLQQIIEETNSAKLTKPTKKNNPVVKSSLVEEEKDLVELFDDDDDDSDYQYDNDSDSDWHLTPAVKKRRRTDKKSDSKTKKSTSGTNENDTFTTAVSQPESENSHDVNLKKACKCRKGCRTNRCGCRLDGSQCSSRCRCIGCTNNKKMKLTFDDDEMPTNETEEKENINGQISENSSESSEKIFLQPPNVAPKTPPLNVVDENAKKMARLTQINFVTPTSKKKFLDNIPLK